MKVTRKSEHLKLSAHVGTWYVVDESIYKGRKVFLVEHEQYGDEAPCLIVDEDMNIVLEGVYNGFDDLKYI